MRRSFFILILFILSCKSLSETEKLHQTLTGKWLVVSPDHNLKNDRQEFIYSRIQDSIVELTGLKLIRLYDSGVFQQIDSLKKTGKWGLTADNVVFVERGGQGFETFSAHYTSYEDGLLELTEFVEAEGEKIELVWNLKKITGSPGSALFDDENNEWRKKPNQAESEKQLRQRLSGMLRFYSHYYKLVTKEASFFVTTRILLPFKFYQHAIGMRPFDDQSFFAKLFFNTQQAQAAWRYLKLTINKSGEFPRKKDYVEEYAEFMEKMADVIKETI